MTPYASYSLMGHTVKVFIVPEVDWKTPDAVGTYEPHKHRILIRGGLSESLTQHTFYHEMLHSIAGAMDLPLNENEKDIDIMAGLLHQAMSSLKAKRVAKRKKTC